MKAKTAAPYARRLSFAKKVALALAGTAAVAAPIVVGMMSAPRIRAQSAATPKFEVASIKPCRNEDIPPPGKSRSGGGNLSPAELRQDCTTVKNLINGAYVLFANGHVNPMAGTPVEGGPAWIDSERYRIDAKAEGARSQGMMRGPMLQALLEDRFKLRIHRETREVPAYALTVAKGGPKLRRFKEGSCTPLDLTILEQFPPPPFPKLPLGQKYCGGIDPADGRSWVSSIGRMKGPNVTVEARAMSIDDFIKFSLGQSMDRPVINQTAITGLFDFHLEYAPHEGMPEFRDAGPGGAPGAAPADPVGPSIFTALQQQLGLKLKAARGFREFLVIDQVEKPSGN